MYWCRLIPHSPAFLHPCIFYRICIYLEVILKVERRGKRPWVALTRAGLDLLDIWFDANATPHDRRSPLGEALAVTLAETRLFL